jgi:hypothetical protein
MAFDGDPATRWGGPVDSRSGWLEVDLGNEVSVSAAVIQEGWDRTRKFSVQYKVGDEWKNAAEGTTIGDDGLEMDFVPVKARVFRLNITESTDALTIWEFQLFGENSPRTSAGPDTPAAEKTNPTGQWRSAPPADCPFKPSASLTGVAFTGRHAEYTGADIWYPSWASDGNLYSPWTDGVLDGMDTASGAGTNSNTGHAVMWGDDPQRLTLRNTSPPKVASALPYPPNMPHFAYN